MRTGGIHARRPIAVHAGPRNEKSVRFAEQPQAGIPPVIGILYVQRWAAGQADAVQVVLTTEDKDAAGPKRKA